jgi:tetratricopeptide (TPR) repeat protein
MRIRCLRLVTMMCALLGAQLGLSQRLLDQERYDVLMVRGARPLKVLPIPLPGRRVPSDPDPQAKLTIRLLDDDEREFAILWKDIESIQLFEQLLLTEAERLTEAEEFDEAFAYYYRLDTSYNGMEGLDASLNRFLYSEARSLARSRDYAKALSSIEELYQRAPDFRFAQNSLELRTFLNRLVDRMVSEYVEAGEYAAARSTVVRIAKEYEELPSADRWIDRLQELAVERRGTATAQLGNQEYRAAIETVREMLEIWPEVAGAAALESELGRRFPSVTVGVLQSADRHDSFRLDHWGDARVGGLVHRSLVDFLGPGPEGGQYQFAFGLVERSDDLRSLTFRLNQQAIESGTTGYELANSLLDMASPSSARYRIGWGSLVKSLAVEDVNRIRVELRRPFLVPEALLHSSPVRDSEQRPNQTDLAGDGLFRIVASAGAELRFAAKSFRPGDRLAEVIEVKFDTAQQAIESLKRGRIDVVDRVFPADAVRMRDEVTSTSPIQVDQYALPTVHLLIPNEDNPFLADPAFRRALLFAIDRESILRRELLGGHDVSGCRVISGPFPIGAGGRDPLAYAYDATIEPRSYRPELASLLASVAVDRVTNRETETAEEAPVLTPVVLGYPALETARIACQAIAGQLKVVGVECTLLEFPRGETRDSNVDLTYVEVAIQEPLVDAERLLGFQGMCALRNPHVAHALRYLNKARNWSEVSEGLFRIHRVVHDEVAVIPLWQMTNFFAYNKRLRNVGDRPLRLYENIDQWRIGSQSAVE